jgi:hypothetical protein
MREVGVAADAGLLAALVRRSWRLAMQAIVASSGMDQSVMLMAGPGTVGRELELQTHSSPSGNVQFMQGFRRRN